MRPPCIPSFLVTCPLGAVEFLCEAKVLVFGIASPVAGRLSEGAENLGALPLHRLQETTAFRVAVPLGQRTPVAKCQYHAPSSLWVLELREAGKAEP